MHEVLKKHVLDHVWCTPLLDFHSIYKPQRITPTNGARKWVWTVRDRYRLPTDDQYHVFQIGQVPPTILAMDKEFVPNTWYSLSYLVNRDAVQIDAYTTNGQYFPRFEIFLTRTANKNVLVAIRRYNDYLDLNHEDLYLRFYKNAWFGTDEFHQGAGVLTNGKGLHTEGMWINTVADRLAFQAKFNQFKDLGIGHTQCAVGGRQIKVPSDKTIALGEWAEILFDASVAEVHRIPISTLETFDSVLDSVRKYLVHPPTTLNKDLVYWKDDVDFFLFREVTPSIQKGTYVHQNKLNSVRMITHRDYSLGVGDLEQYALNLGFWDHLNQAVLEIHLRHSAYQKTLPFEHNRIHELYKIDDDRIVPAMLGHLSAVDEWRVEHLEQAAYPKIMRARDMNIQYPDIRQALGYNAITRLLNLNPVSTEEHNGYNAAKRPPQCYEGCLVLEYDVDGKFLLGDYQNTVGTWYYTQNPAAQKVEFYPGPAGVNAQRFMGDTSITVRSDESILILKCPISQGSPTYQWEVANTSDYTDVEIGPSQRQITMTLDPQLWYFYFVKDSGVVYYEKTIASGKHRVELALGYGARVNGVWEWQEDFVPFDFVQLTMNGRSLVEGIDYTVKWPNVIIHSKAAYDTGKSAQDVTVLMMGIPENHDTYNPVKDVGFTVHGAISHDHRFQVRDDRVNRIIVDGKLLSEDDVFYAEEEDSPKTLPNARPYSLRTPPIPVTLDTFDVDRYSWLQQSRDLDARVSAWLTDELPQPEIPGPNLYNGKYELISPTLSAIVRDLEEGYLDATVIPDVITDVWLYEFLEDYLWLMEYDPASVEQEEFVAIHPHGYRSEISLPIRQYDLVVRANHVFFDDRVKIHQLIKIGV